MIPTLAPGELLLIRYFSPRNQRFQVGDIVVAQVAGRFDIKRISAIGEAVVELVGDNSAVSTDSRHYGSVSKSDIVAAAIFRVWPKPGRILSAQEN